MGVLVLVLLLISDNGETGDGGAGCRLWRGVGGFASRGFGKPKEEKSSVESWRWWRGWYLAGVFRGEGVLLRTRGEEIESVAYQASVFLAERVER